MDKKGKLTLIFTIFLFFGFIINAQALTFEKLPVKQSSQRWSVEISEGTGETSPQQSKLGPYDTRTLTIENTGKQKLITAEVTMFRNEPKSATKFALAACPETLDCKQLAEDEKLTLAAQFNNGSPYNFINFPLAEKATELEVEITWTEKGNEGRPLKERFIFSEE